jgi:hypothetical protein
MYAVYYSIDRASWVIALDLGFALEYYSKADSEQQAIDDAAYLNGE